MDLKRRALGRGLGALIPSAAAEVLPQRGEDDNLVPLDKIRPNPLQPRETFSDAAITDLADSIREKGLLQPLLVRRSGAGFELIAGERRYRAALRAGLTRVPVVVHDVDDRESLEIALIENIQREDLNPLEEARAYQRLANEFGLRQEEIAQRVGKNRSTVANSLRLLNLPHEIQQQLASGAITAGHARSLLMLGSVEEQSALARDIVEQRLSVRDTETRTRARARKPVADLDVRAAESALARAIGTKVRIVPGRNGGGKIQIDYYSLEELNGLLGRLGATA